MTEQRKTSQCKTLDTLGLTAKKGRNPEVCGIAVDSRLVKEGFLFAALPGTQIHGGEFIQYALRLGATAILTDAEGMRIARDVLAESDVAIIVAQDPRQTLAYAAALWFGVQPEVLVAITGTNGKTSVATFLRQIWTELGLEAVNLGTTGVEGAYEVPLKHTTPEPITLHRVLKGAAEAGVTHGAMEASSHGLAQRRLDGVVLQAAGFTNFSQDHLDYHKDFEDYFKAKAGLFDRVLPENGVAVINTDDPKGFKMSLIAKERGIAVISVGKEEGSDLRIESQRYGLTGQEVRFRWQRKVHQARLELIGGFQAENVMLAAGLAIACGAEAQAVFDTLEHLKTVRGRMQLAATRANGAAIFVDFAHTPDAVKTALKAMRPHVLGRIVVVLGAGGDRDTSKRALMGQAATEYADVVFVTDDNPRTEAPADIRAAVMEGAPQAREFGDRAEAILRAVDELEAGDALLIAGKGHESGQIVGDDVLPFDDVEQASVAVAALDGRLA